MCSEKNRKNTYMSLSLYSSGKKQYLAITVYIYYKEVSFTMSNIITVDNQGSLQVPDQPVIPFIEGDGTGADIWAAAKRVLEAAVEKAYDGKKEIDWKEVYAGQKAFDKTGEWLPKETLEEIDKYKIAIKGPLTTP